MKRTTLVLLALAAAWLIAVVALRQFMPCDPTLQLAGKLPEFFACVMERRR
jgi:hypothetical protein